MVNDPYQVLGVSRNATQDEIKKAYRQKARQYHPDTHPNDPEANRKMNEINEAYDMLTHPEKYARRQQQGNPYGNSGYGSSGYNRNGAYSNSGSYYTNNSGYGSSGQNGNGYNGSYGGPNGWYGNFNFEDFFNAFGGGTYGGNVNINPQPEAGDSQEIRSAITYINAGQYQSALQLLARMTSDKRNARWYYLCAVCYYGGRDYTHAVDFMQKAVQLDSNNSTYQQYLSQFMSASRTQSASNAYGSYGGSSYGSSGHSSTAAFSLRRLLVPIIMIIFIYGILFGGCFGCGRGCFGCYGRSYYGNPYYQQQTYNNSAYGCYGTGANPNGSGSNQP